MEVFTNFGSIAGTVGPTVGVIGGIIGIVGIVGGLVGYFGKSRGDSIIAYQAREIELRDGSVARLEKSEAALIAERDSLQRQVEDLKGLAQGSPQLVKLTSSIDSLVKEFGKHFKNERRKS